MNNLNHDWATQTINFAALIGKTEGNTKMQFEDRLFNYFEDFPANKCFFSGKELTENEHIPVFPQWLLERYDLSNQTMMMLGGNRVKYGEMFVPFSSEIQAVFLPLEKEIEIAFQSGYDAVARLSEKKLFLWMAEMMLSLLYQDIQYGIRSAVAKGTKFVLSPLLTRKYQALHFMLQSLWEPLDIAEKPYSIYVTEVGYSKDGFNFRDETKNLNFSLGMNGFGIVACLQDNGLNEEYHKSLLEKISGLCLHPIQFEELCARFIYSNFILEDNSGYVINEVDDRYVMLRKEQDKPPAFHSWDDKMYGSVLAEYWKPWGLTGKDIGVFPDTPLSFLINEMTNEIILPEKVEMSG